MLLSVQGMGILYTACIFVVCVILVFGVRLARIGYRSLSKKLPPDPPPRQEKDPEPVYFLVERKKKRARTEYAPPKRIHFK